MDEIPRYKDEWAAEQQDDTALGAFVRRWIVAFAIAIGALVALTSWLVGVGVERAVIVGVVLAEVLLLGFYLPTPPHRDSR